LPAPWSHGAGPPRRSRLGLPWLLRPDLRPSPSPGTSPWRSPAVEAYHAAGLAPPHLCGAAAPPRSVDGRLPARRCARWSAPAPARPGGAAKHCRCPLPRPTRPTIRSPVCVPPPLSLLLSDNPSRFYCAPVPLQTLDPSRVYCAPAPRQTVDTKLS
jgi:hypothetical protein